MPPCLCVCALVCLRVGWGGAVAHLLAPPLVGVGGECYRCGRSGAVHGRVHCEQWPVPELLSIGWRLFYRLPCPSAAMALQATSAGPARHPPPSKQTHKSTAHALLMRQGNGQYRTAEWPRRRHPPRAATPSMDPGMYQNGRTPQDERGVPPLPLDPPPLLPFQCLRQTAKILLRRLWRQED